MRVSFFSRGNTLARLPSTGRTLAIVAALVLAGIATFAIYQYVDGLREEAFQEAELVEVYVASEVIPAGTAAETVVSRGLVEVDDIPREDRPNNAITSLDQIQGLVTLDRVLPGEVIQAGRFGDPASAGATGFEIPEDRQAISIEVGVPPGVAGFIRPQDRISVIAHIAAPAPAEVVLGPDGTPVEPAQAGDAAEETRSQFVVQDIEVLAVGRRVVTTNEQGQTQDQVQQTESILTTVAVTDEDAERLVFALNEGSLYFTLLPEGYESAQTPGRTFDDLFSTN